MKKKIVSSLVAVSLVFGTAAVLPEGVQTAQNAITASAKAYKNGEIISKDGADYVYNNGKLTLFMFGNNKKEVTIPEKVNGLYVDTIGTGALGSYSSVPSVIHLPDSITTIEGAAFDYNGNISSIKIPATVTSMDGGYTFFQCGNLKSIVLPDGIKTIGEQTFTACGNLTSVSIPNTVTRIDKWAFYICNKLKSVVVPDSVKKFGDLALGYTLDDKKMAAKKVKGFTIITTKGSAADKYAKENGFKVRYDKNVALAQVKGLGAKTYTGKAVKPTPTVKFNGKTLKKGTDYTLSYKNNKKVGLASVIIKGKGKYSGTLTKVFRIVPKKSAVTKVTSAKAGSLTAKLKKVSGVTGYELAYSTSKKFTNKTTKSISSAKLTQTVNKLTSGKTYYVKVRTYKTVKGIRYNSKYSTVKKIKVK